MKTLFISDLDGTLLRNSQKTSAYTNKVINALLKEGICFSFATARSFSSAKKAAAGITASFPLIVHNGAFIIDNERKGMLLENYHSFEDSHFLISELLEGGIFPVVYSLISGNEQFSYLPKAINKPTADFIESRKYDYRNNPVNSAEDLFLGNVFNIACIGEDEKLRIFYEKYKEKYHCVYQKDYYSNEPWLEFIPKTASKANAAKQLASLLGCEKIVAFGDGLNDIDMFEAADEAYAVANAVPALKEIATAVILSNEEDGVAKWLFEKHSDILGGKI